MNPVTIANLAVLTLGTTSLAAAVEMAKTGNFIGGGIAVVVGVAALYAYEKLPSTPTT